jgi:hypothetical protein
MKNKLIGAILFITLFSLSLGVRSGQAEYKEFPTELGNRVNELEPNDNKENANLLNFVDYAEGAISSLDDIDTYKLEVKEDRKVFVAAKADNGLYFVHAILKDTNNRIPPLVPHLTKYNESYQEYNLQAGMYYIYLSKLPKVTDEAIGYKLKVIMDPIITDYTPPDAPQVNPFNTNDTLLTGHTEPFSTVYLKIDGEWKTEYHYIVGADGNFFIELPKQKTGTIIAVYADDYIYNNTSVPTFIYVKDTNPLTPTKDVNQFFKDVSGTYSSAVTYLVNNRVTSGVSPNEFGTNHKIKRVDAAIWFANILKLDLSNEKPTSFLDVPKRGWAAINALEKAGVASGKTMTYFGANDEVTRGEMALMVQKAYNLGGYQPEITFTDVSSRYSLAVENMVKNNITKGKTSTTFGTNMPISRGEMALFLYRADAIKYSK